MVLFSTDKKVSPWQAKNYHPSGRSSLLLKLHPEEYSSSQAGHSSHVWHSFFSCSPGRRFQLSTFLNSQSQICRLVLQQPALNVEWNSTSAEFQRLRENWKPQQILALKLTIIKSQNEYKHHKVSFFSISLRLESCH